MVKNRIGIDVGGTNVKLALVNDKGQIKYSNSVPTRAEMGHENRRFSSRCSSGRARKHRWSNRCKLVNRKLKLLNLIENLCNIFKAKRESSSVFSLF